MVVSLPSSLTGVVRKKEVSDYFYAKASSSGGGNNNKRGGKGRYFNEVAAGDISLREIFKEGQASTCSCCSGMLPFPAPCVRHFIGLLQAKLRDDPAVRSLTSIKQYL